MTRMEEVGGKGGSKINASGIRLRFLRMPGGRSFPLIMNFWGFFYNKLQVCNLPLPPPFPTIRHKRTFTPRSKYFSY